MKAFIYLIFVVAGFLAAGSFTQAKTKNTATVRVLHADNEMKTYTFFNSTELQPLKVDKQFNCNVELQPFKDSDKAAAMLTCRSSSTKAPKFIAGTLAICGGAPALLVVTGEKNITWQIRMDCQ